MRKLLIILFFLPLFANSQKSYWETSATTIDGKNAYVSVPASYTDSVPKRYPVIVFIPGNGETGSNITLLKKYGPHRFILDSLFMTGIVHPTTGDTIESIIISFQPSASWVGEAQVKEVIDTLRLSNRWRIDTFRISVTGLSNGGWAFANHISNDTVQAKQIANGVLMHHPITDNGATNAIKHGLMAEYVRKGGVLWGFEDSISDGRLMNITRDSCNNAVASSYRYTGRPTVTGGHCCWNNWYTPNYTESISGTTMNIYQWMLTRSRPGAYEYWGTPGSLTANAGNDTAYIYDQGGVAVPFTLNGSADNATSPTYSWAALAGNPTSTTITSSTSASTTVTGANVPGFYGYELTVTDGTSDKDTVYLQLRDLMQRGLRPCREGAGIRRYLGDSLAAGRITTTEIYLQYITRDGFLTNVLGGDTVVIMKNPNNDTGYWKSIHIGDISGSRGCPIVFVPDTSGLTVVSAGAGGSRGWYIGVADLGDSNTTAFLKFDGGAWYNSTSIRHGFRADNRNATYDSSNTTTYSLNMGIAGHLIHHVEFTGFGVWNAGYLAQFKIYSDSTMPFTIWNNFRQTGNWVHHNYAYKTNYEGLYLGHTDWDGSYQVGNDGRTLMMDSLIVENNVFDRIGQDGIQISNHGNGCIVRNNLIHQSGYRNVSSHRWSAFIGGNANGSIYGNTIINSRGPIGSLGYGSVSLYNNVIDSVDDGSNVENAFYINQASWTGNTDSLKINIHHNVVSRIAQTGNQAFVHVVNAAGLMGKGAIRNNTFVHPTKTLIGQMVTDNASDTVELNTIQSAINLDTCSLGSLDSYRMFKLLMLTNAPGTDISFYDLPAGITPPRFRRRKAMRLIFIH